MRPARNLSHRCHCPSQTATSLWWLAYLNTCGKPILQDCITDNSTVAGRTLMTLFFCLTNLAGAEQWWPGNRSGQLDSLRKCVKGKEDVECGRTGKIDKWRAKGDDGACRGSSSVKNLIGSHPLPMPTLYYPRGTRAWRHILVLLLAQHFSQLLQISPHRGWTPVSLWC